MSQSSSSRKRSAKSSGSGTAGNTKSSYDPNFEQNLIDGGIYPHNLASKPKNVQETKQYITKLRDSLSPSRFGDEEFEDF